MNSSDFHIALLDIADPSADLGALRGLLTEAVALDNHVWRDLFGHGDFDTVETSYIESLQQQDHARKSLLVALTGKPFASAEVSGLPAPQPADDRGDAVVIGTAMLYQSKHDNFHLADGVEIGVHPDHRRQGVGSALLAALEQVAREWGITTVISWANHANGAGHRDAVRPSEGDFSIARDAAAEFALHHGFSLGQCERHSVQPAQRASVVVPAVPAGYEMVRWRDACPEELRADKAVLNMAMAADVPRGELDLEDEVWTAERVASGDEQRYRHHQGLTVAMRHLESGELAGFTNIRRRPELPQVAWQDVTIVLKAHRGHGLGLLMKAENLAWLQQEWPEVERVHTWNAGENQWMLAINDRLGYQVAMIGGAWQKKLGSAAR